MFVGIETNEGDSDYLNFYIKGDAEAWVAVGFSPSLSMVRENMKSLKRGEVIFLAPSLA